MSKKKKRNSSRVLKDLQKKIEEAAKNTKYDFEKESPKESVFEPALDIPNKEDFKVWEFTGEEVVENIYGREVHLKRIVYLKGFSIYDKIVKAGELGGLIESEKNLAQSTRCFIDYYTKVYGNARIRPRNPAYCEPIMIQESLIRDNAKILSGRIIDCVIIENARVSCRKLEHCVVKFNASIIHSNLVSSNSTFKDNTVVHYGCSSRVRTVETVSLINAPVNAPVTINNTILSGNTKVTGVDIQLEYCELVNNSVVTSNITLKDLQTVEYKSKCTNKLKHREFLIDQLYYQCDLVPEPGDESVIAYKYIQCNGSSFFDNGFKYDLTPGSVIEVEKPNEDPDRSCGSGLHFSNAKYGSAYCKGGKVILVTARIYLDDIITVLDGKIRCRKATILSHKEVITVKRPIITKINALGEIKTQCTILPRSGKVLIPRNVNYVYHSKLTKENYGITSLQIEEGTKLGSVPECLMLGCKALKSVKLASPLHTVRHSAFASCENLCELFLPRSINEIQENAFRNTALKRVDVEWDSMDEVYIQHGAFDNGVEFVNIHTGKLIGW